MFFNSSLNHKITKIRGRFSDLLLLFELFRKSNLGDRFISSLFILASILLTVQI